MDTVQIRMASNPALRALFLAKRPFFEITPVVFVFAGGYLEALPRETGRVELVHLF